MAANASEIQINARFFQGVVGKLLRKIFGNEAVIDPMQLNNAIVAPPGGDGGRDFEVKVPAAGEYRLFGVAVRPGSTCYVEVKCVSSGAANFATASSNLARVQHSPADQVFVVTNAHFAPSAQVDIVEDFRALKDRLHLIEGRAFRHWCEIVDLAWPDGIAPSVPTDERIVEGLAVEANISAVREAGGQVQVFSTAFRNLSDEVRSVEVFAVSDVEWRFTERHPFKGGFADLSSPPATDKRAVAKTLIVPPWQCRAIRLSGRFIGERTEPGLQRQPSRGEAEDGARIVARINGRAVPLFMNLRPLRVCFKPRFAGCRNMALRKRLRPLFEGIERGDRPAALQFIHIDGPAGVGKSRLVDEIVPPPEFSHILLLHHTVEAQEDDSPRDDRYWSGVRSRLKARSGLDTGWLKTLLICIVSLMRLPAHSSLAAISERKAR